MLWLHLWLSSTSFIPCFSSLSYSNSILNCSSLYIDGELPLLRISLRTAESSISLNLNGDNEERLLLPHLDPRRSFLVVPPSASTTLQRRWRRTRCTSQLASKVVLEVLKAFLTITISVLICHLICVMYASLLVLHLLCYLWIVLNLLCPVSCVVVNCFKID
jgi:uncharacterized membrane protein